MGAARTGRRGFLWAPKALQIWRVGESDIEACSEALRWPMKIHMAQAASSLARAIEHHRAGRLRDAERIYHRILARNPNDSDALHLLGLVTFQTGDFQGAIGLIREAIRQKPSEPVYYDNLGKIFQAQGRAAQAAECFEAVIRCRPADAAALVNLGNSYYRLGRPDDAIACYRRALEQQPDCLDAWINLGHTLNQTGRSEEGIGWLRKALDRKPDCVEALLNLGAVLGDRGESEAAAALARRALSIKPDFAEAHHNLGVALRSQGRLSEAAASYREALRLKGDRAETASGLGVVLLEQGRLDEAAAAFREALRIDPRFAVAHSNLLFCLNYFSDLDPSQIYTEHLRWEKEQAAALLPLRKPHANHPDPGRRLRIGYVSPDFRSHPVAHLFGPLLAAHDRRQFECFCYSSTLQPDAVTRSLQMLAGAWRDVHALTDEQLARLVREDGIDILVDLAGHTAGSRLRAFAAGPAPVQVTYIGYPNTTGLSAINYRITDAWADPVGAEGFHSEELVRLPSGFFCYQPLSDAPPVADQPFYRSGVFTFGSFNNRSKITADVVAVWAAVLRQSSNCRLLLKAKALGDEGTRQELLRMFAAHGVEPGRIELAGVIANAASHLAEYGRVDLALDTFPYNGTVTTCEALWMGVPVVALAGRTHAARVGVSILSRIGLSEFVTGSIDEYIAGAVHWSANPGRLRELRAGMRERLVRSPLCGAALVARELEQAYRQMWRRWCRQAGASGEGLSI
jgi:protein O-GlcNAc transferase